MALIPPVTSRFHLPNWVQVEHEGLAQARLDASVDGAPPRCHFPRGTSRAARLPSLERAYELGMAAKVRR